jgi:Holliday junction resolvase RusA-like endonuclease
MAGVMRNCMFARCKHTVSHHPCHPSCQSPSPSPSLLPPLFTVEAIIIVSSPRATHLQSINSVQLEVKGEPMVQIRMQAKGIFKHAKWFAILWDPSSKAKKLFKVAVKSALEETGLSAFPVYMSPQILEIVVTFMIYNSLKDVDNLLKFVMDALQSTVYGNDRYVYKVTAEKVLVPRKTEEVTYIEIIRRIN